MADELKDKIDEESTTFGAGDSPDGPYFYPTGVFGKFFAKFFTTKAQDHIKTQRGPDPTPLAPLAGDTVTADKSEVIKPDTGLGFSYSRNSIFLPQSERNRRERYTKFEEMDDYPEIGTAFDIYADDSTQKTLRNDFWTIKCDDQGVIDEVKRLFDRIRLDRVYWDIIRNACKYGDCFTELVIDLDAPQKGIQRLKVLNPNYILRVENEYGYLTDFIQVIPEQKDVTAFGANAESMLSSRYIYLDKNQIIHYRLYTSDPVYYPYGKSIASHATKVFRSLKLMEDAMLIYRLTRAPERRIFYIDVGNMPTNKAEAYIDRVKEKFKKEKYYDARTGNIDTKFNPISADEDFYVATRAGAGTKIETIQGAQNLDAVEDVRYFRDKLLAALKIPKDYIVEKDKSPERKANLSQLDAKFARTITRVQRNVEKGFEALARRHLRLLGYPESIVSKVRVELPDPSDVHSKRKLEVDQLKTVVVQSVLALQLFPKSTVYKEYYNMTTTEIDALKVEMEAEAKEMLLQQAAQMGGGPPPPGGGPPIGGGPPPMGAGPPMIGGPGGMPPGGAEKDVPGGNGTPKQPKG